MKREENDCLQKQQNSASCCIPWSDCPLSQAFHRLLLRSSYKSNILQSFHPPLSLFPTLLGPPLFPFKCMDSSLIIIVKYMCTYIHTYSNFILFHVCECYACMCISVPHAGSAHGSKKRARDSTELGEPEVVSCHIGAWN